MGCHVDSFCFSLVVEEPLTQSLVLKIMNYIKAAKTVGILFAVLFILGAVIHAIRTFRFMERFEGHFINGHALSEQFFG